MRLALKIMSITAVVIGSFALLGAATEASVEDAVYALLGGGFFLVEGILALIYIHQQKQN